MSEMSATQRLLPTARLILRPLRPSDAGLMSLYAGDPRVARMTTSIPHPNPPGAAEAYIAATLAGRRDDTVWAMDGTGQGAAELIGLISAKPHGDAVEVGYWVGPPFWNTGYASEALGAVVDHLFARGVARIVAAVFQDNPGSARVITKAGFSYDGAGEAYSVARGAMVPQWRYRLDAPAVNPLAEEARDEVS